MLPCQYQVSHFLAYEGRGEGGGEILLLFSIVNCGNKGAAKRKLHRNKISSSLGSLSRFLARSLARSLFPLLLRATGVLLRIFRLHCLLRTTISNRLSLRINLSPSPSEDFQRLPLTKLHHLSRIIHNATVSISNFIEFPGWSSISRFISKLCV